MAARVSTKPGHPLITAAILPAEHTLRQRRPDRISDHLNDDARIGDRAGHAIKMMDQAFVTRVGDWHARALERVGVSLTVVPERVEFSSVDMGRRKGAQVDRAKR